MRIFILSIFALMLTSCGYDGIGLEGKWNMVQSSVPDPPSSSDVKPGVVTWTFDERSRKISIVDKTGYEEEFKTLKYELSTIDTITHNNVQTIVAESNLGTIYLAGDKLTVSQSASDGPSYYFIR